MKDNRAWFFTNEKIAKYINQSNRLNQVKTVYSIGGGGDFIFNLLAINKNIDKAILCDNRDLAAKTINFKIKLFKGHCFDEIIKLFDDKNTINKLKKSGSWYGESFLALNNKKDYLEYLAEESKYLLLRKNLKTIQLIAGDFSDQLNLSRESHFDLVNASNILDSKSYCKDAGFCLKIIRTKLDDMGQLFVLTQNNPKKMIKLIEENGFTMIDKEIHKYSILSLWRGSYDYSILLFEKELGLER